MARKVYRVTWQLDGGKKLTRLIFAKDQATAERMANSENFQRQIFRNANMMQRSRSEYEYMDKAPRVSSVKVEPASVPDAKGRSFA